MPFHFEVSFFALMLMNGIVNLTTTLPSAPGYVGTFDAPGIALLTAYGVAREIAAGYTLVLHAALWLPITAAGGILLPSPAAALGERTAGAAHRARNGAFVLRTRTAALVFGHCTIRSGLETHRMKIAIIGAGIGGMAAAFDLVNAGHEVTIFEAANHVGGLAAGFKEANWDWTVEHYYHHWFTTDQSYARSDGRTGLARQSDVFRKVKNSGL